MILLQVLLIAAFLLLIVRFISNPDSNRIRAWKKILGIVFILFSIVAVLLPDLINKIANFFGIGRGADLLLYLLTLSFIFVVFNLYIKNQQDQKKIVKLARKIAIIEANLRSK